MRHGTHLGQVLALQSRAHGANRMDVHPAGLAPQAQYLLDDAGAVLHGSGIRHGEDRGVPAHGGCTGAGEDGLRGFTAGLAQMSVNIHEAGKSHQAVQVVAHGIGWSLSGGVGPDCSDDSIGQENVGGILTVGADTGQKMGGHSWFPSSARRR